MTEEDLNETLQKARSELDNAYKEQMKKPSPLMDIVKFFTVVFIFLACTIGIFILGYSVYQHMNKPVEKVIEPVPNPEPQKENKEYREYKRPFGNLNN